jgi:hypothetical protein
MVMIQIALGKSGMQIFSRFEGYVLGFKLYSETKMERCVLKFQIIQ